MAEKSQQRFDVYFAGECLEGHDPDAVRAALGKLFRASDKTLDRLFCGEQQPVKRGCDKATALNYQRAMSKAGAKPIITRVSDAPSTGDAATDSEAEETFTLAPRGSDVLRPEERRRQQSIPVEINIDHLNASPAGERLGPPAPEATPVPAPDYELAAPGTVLGTAGPTPAAPPDTGALSLEPEAHDLSDCAPPVPAAPALELDHLLLEDAGADILTEEQRRKPHAPAPDVSHLSVEQPRD